MESVLWIAGVVVVGWVILSLSIHFIKGGMFTTAASGLGVLLLVSVVTGGNTILGVNAVTASTAALLGVPGVVGMLLVKLIAFI